MVLSESSLWRGGAFPEGLGSVWVGLWLYVLQGVHGRPTPLWALASLRLFSKLTEKKEKKNLLPTKSAYYRQVLHRQKRLMLCLTQS